MNCEETILKSCPRGFELFQANLCPQGGALTYASQLRLKDEPSVAYAKAEDKNGRPTQLLISRHYVPFDLEPRSRDTEYASYLSPLGRIVSRKVGQAHEFQVKRSGSFWNLISFDRAALMIGKIGQLLNNPE